MKRAIALACAVFAIGCAGRRTWTEDGHVLGTIETVERPDHGRNLVYRDDQQRVRRIERFDAAGTPAPGVFRTTVDWDVVGIVEWRESDARGALVANPKGYAIGRVKRDHGSTEERFFDVADHPVERIDGVHRIFTRPTAEGRCGSRREHQNLRGDLVSSCAGYAVANLECRGDRATDLRFRDARGQPVDATLKGAAAEHVRWEYVVGVRKRPVVAEHFIDRAGETRLTNFYSQFPGWPGDDCR